MFDGMHISRWQQAIIQLTIIEWVGWWGDICLLWKHCYIWAASSEFGTYHLCEQRRFRQTCASAQSRQNLRCSLIQAVSQEEPSDRKPDPWHLWMAGHAQLKFVMTECSKTQIRLTGLIYFQQWKRQCQSLNAWYQSSSSLRWHLERHADKIHDCDICHKSFGRKDELQRHLSTHNKEVLSVCDKCGMCFPASALL